MSGITNEYTNVCRGCLRETFDEMRPLHTTFKGNVTFYQMFWEVLGNEISETYQMPTNLCAKCEKDLTTSYKFKNQLMQNEKILIALNFKIEEPANDIEIKYLEEFYESENEFLDTGTEGFIQSLEIKPIILPQELNNSNVNQCLNCNLQFDNLRDYELHYQQTHQRKSINKKNITATEETRDDSLNLETEEEGIIQSQENKLKRKTKRELMRQETKKRHCNKCNVRFKSVPEYLTHVRQAHRTKSDIRQCLKCNLQFEDITDYWFHYRRVHRLKAATKQTASEDTGDTIEIYELSNVETEMDATMLERPQIGEESNESLNVESSSTNTDGTSLEVQLKPKTLRELLRQETKKRYCKKCNLRFKSVAEYLAHARQAHRTKSHRRQCLKCNIDFSNNTEYLYHYRREHRHKTAVCSICGKIVSHQHMQKHLTAHEKAKLHLCTECGKRFTLAENLKKHWRIHTGDKRYTCEHCGEKFIHWNSKRSHIRTTHTHEKKYQCSICGKAFAQSSNLFRHMRSHTGELPHTCHFCEKKFVSTSELRNHLVIHTKERNHKCETCQKCFGTKKTLLTHMKIHTGEKNYVCTVCQKAFTQAHVLRKHLKTHPGAPIPPPGVVLSIRATQKNKPIVDEI